MKKSKFTEEQIAFALKQPETGTTVEEICRKKGISQATFYAWRHPPAFSSGTVWSPALS